jgi:hypothetical protein
VSTGNITSSQANLVIDSSVVTGATCGIQATGSNVTVQYSDFWQNTANTCGGANPVGANGNVSADPKFVSAAAHDYQLGTGSACLDAGSTSAANNDIDGSRNDCGAWGGPFALGGGW